MKTRKKKKIKNREILRRRRRSFKKILKIKLLNIKNDKMYNILYEVIFFL